MANSQSIKQKFLDILFEPDEPEEDVEVHKEKVKENKTSTIKASDLLYGKKDIKNEVFIDIDKNTTNVETELPKEEEPENKPYYVSTPNISPIFGTIDTNKKKKVVSSNGAVDFAYTDKPSGNYLDMVMSPIYGYDTNSANEARSKFDMLQKSRIHDGDITEDLSDIFATDEFKQEVDKDEEYTANTEVDLFSDFVIKEDK